MAEAIQTEYYKEDQNMIAKDKKQNIIAEYGRTPNDTGSPEVQVALLTARIEELTAQGYGGRYFCLLYTSPSPRDS